MLINVFGVWVNPSAICYIEYAPCANQTSAAIYFAGIATSESSTEWNYTLVEGKTPSEVGKEINRQLSKAEGK